MMIFETYFACLMRVFVFFYFQILVNVWKSEVTLEMDKAYVANVIDPLMFWARFGHDVDLLAEEHLEELICEYVSENDRLMDTDDLVLTQNQVIIALSSDHDRWLRATVVADVSSCSSSEVDVVFTGYGSNELVAWKDIITSAPDYVHSWNQSAECFELDGIKPPGDVFSESAISRFASLVVGKMLPCRRITSGNPDAPDRLVIYSGDDHVETIQGILVDGGFAKWSTDDGGSSKQGASYSYPFSTVSTSASNTSGRIPDFNARSLFFKNDSPPPPPSELPKRDFEMEERCKFLASSVDEFPTRTDDAYLGLRPLRPSEVEPFDEKLNSIRGEIARVGGRQLVRPNTWNFPRSYPQSPKSDWRCPSNCPRDALRASPSDDGKNGKGIPFESMSFKQSLQTLLTKGRDLKAIHDYLQPILNEDNTHHDRLFLCISTIVDHQLKFGKGLQLNFEVLESLKGMNGFPNCLGNLIQQIDKSYLQISTTPSKEIRGKLKPFAEFLALLMSMFHNLPDVVNRVASIAENWARCCNDGPVNSQLCEVCATCLKHFICGLSFESVDLIKEKSDCLLIEAKEKLFSDRTSRSVKEILLDLLLCVEQRKAKEEMMQKIISQSGLPPVECNGSVSSSYSNSIEGLVSSASESPQDADAAKGCSGSSLDDAEFSLAPETTESLPKEEEPANTGAAKTTPRRRNRKKNRAKMSLSQYHATVSSDPAVACNGQASRTDETSKGRVGALSSDGFLMCVFCGSKDGHESASCPDRVDKFFF